MINTEVIKLTMLRAKGKRRNASDLCVYQLISLKGPSIVTSGTQH